MTTLTYYYSLSDAWPILYSEIIYIKYHLQKIGENDRKDQILVLIDELEKVQEEDQTQKILISIFYLLIEHNEIFSEVDHPKTIKFHARADLCKTLNSTFFLQLILNELKSLKKGPEKSKENSEAKDDSKNKKDGNENTQKLNFEFGAKIPQKPTQEENSKKEKEKAKAFKRIVKEKILLDLVNLILSANVKFFNQNYQKELIQSYLDYCLEGINLSMSHSQIHMKRITKILNSLLQIMFLGYEEISINLSEDERVRKIEDVMKLVKAGQDFTDIVQFSRIERVERFYTEMLSKPSNPLAKTIVVGLLRAMLKLATLNNDRGSTVNEKCYNANFEIESNFDYFKYIMDNNEKYTALYRGAIQPNKVYAVKHFLYRSLNFEKHDIQLRKAFKEFICSEAYLRFIKNLHLPFYPDHLNYQLKKENFKDNQGLKFLIAELITERTVCIYYITEILSTIHKVFYQNNYVQSLCFGDLIFEAKGVLVMLKIISEKLPLYETSITRNKLSLIAGEEHATPTEIRSSICLNIVYLIYNISYGFEDVIEKALNANSSQHAFKKLKRKFSETNFLIGEYCSRLIKLQLSLMDRKHKTATANMKIISDNYGSGYTGSNIDFSSSRGSIYNHSVVGGEGPRFDEIGSVRMTAGSNFSTNKNSVSNKRAIEAKFHQLSQLNTIRHLMATVFKTKVDTLFIKPKKLSLTHESMKKMREKINNGYDKHHQEILEKLKKRYQDFENKPLASFKDESMFADLTLEGLKTKAIREKKEKGTKSVLAMYNELYNKTKVDFDFENNYEEWVEEEVMNFIY